jgi:hypothetical protein
LTGGDETIRVNNLGSGQPDLLVLHANVLQSEHPIIRYLNADRPPPSTHRGASEIRVLGSGNTLEAPGWGAAVSDDSRDPRRGLDRVANP